MAAGGRLVVWLLLLSAGIPLAVLRRLPKLLLDYRVVGASKTVGVEPVIVAEYGDRGLRADARLQYRWRSELGRSEVGDEKGLFFSLGLWLNF